MEKLNSFIERLETLSQSHSYSYKEKLLKALKNAELLEESKKDLKSRKDGRKTEIKVQKRQEVNTYFTHKVYTHHT